MLWVRVQCVNVAYVFTDHSHFLRQQEDNYSYATISLVLGKMIVKLERTLSTALHNKDLAQYVCKQNGSKIMNYQQQNRHLRTEAAEATGDLL